MSGSFWVHSVTIKPIKGEKTTESKNAQPKPMRLCEPIKPTRAAKKVPVSNPKTSTTNVIIFHFAAKINK